MTKEAQIKEALASAKAITWDGCHKIYIAMDDNQVELFKQYEYDPIIEITDVDDAFYILCDWYDDSCSLRFIQSVSTVTGNPNDGFISLVPQFVDSQDYL